MTSMATILTVAVRTTVSASTSATVNHATAFRPTEDRP